METSSWRSLFSTSQPGIVPTVSQTPNETFVRHPRHRSGRHRRRTDGTRPPQRCPQSQRQQANLATAKFNSSHLRDRKAETLGTDAARGKGAGGRDWSRRTNVTNLLSTPSATADPSSTLPLEASSRSPQPFSLQPAFAGTLMPASQLSQTEDLIRPAKAGQPSASEPTTGKRRAKKDAADFA